MFRGDRELRRTVRPEATRLAPIFAALASVGVEAEAAVFGEDFADEVREQLLDVAAALVWVDPVSGSDDRARLDPVLREVADAGAWVSAHPDVILKMGTKEVLFTTRHLGWGSDVDLYRTPAELAARLPEHLASGSRVLKQYRGNGGIGVWKVEAAGDGTVRVQGARSRDEVTEDVPLPEFVDRCAKYFEYEAGAGRLIDQPFMPRIRDGIVRCYVVGDEVVGFARQFPAVGVDGQPGGRVFGLPSAKTMFGPDEPSLARLRESMESEWIPGLRASVGVDPGELPALWDADFLLGPAVDGEDSYVLCEINVSAVAPWPAEAVPKLARAVARRLGAG